MDYRDITFGGRWPHFKPRELTCRCCGELWAGDSPDMPEEYEEVLDMLEELRELYGKPMVINSGHRCAAHNAEVGGDKSSQHLEIAFDVRVPREDQERFVNLAARVGFTGIGRYPERGFVHLDAGTSFARRWWG